MTVAAAHSRTLESVAATALAEQVGASTITIAVKPHRG
jgi:hypothetical protein